VTLSASSSPASSEQRLEVGGAPPVGRVEQASGTGGEPLGFAGQVAGDAVGELVAERLGVLSEAAGLQVGNVDFLRRTITVNRQI